MAAYTTGSAFVNHLDDVTGSIEPGKLADLIVLDRDPFSRARGRDRAHEGARDLRRRASPSDRPRPLADSRPRTGRARFCLTRSSGRPCRDVGGW